jgi:curved DNA-binding protein CbpA
MCHSGRGSSFLLEARALSRDWSSIVAEEKDHYATLEIPFNASPFEIEEAYRRAVGTYRPLTRAERAGAHDLELLEAYTTLRNPQSRRKYDSRLGRKPRLTVRLALPVVLIAAAFIAAALIISVLAGGGSSAGQAGEPSPSAHGTIVPAVTGAPGITH